MPGMLREVNGLQRWWLNLGPGRWCRVLRLDWGVRGIFQEIQTTEERLERLHLYLIRYEGWAENQGNYDAVLKSDCGVCIRAGLRWLRSHLDSTQRVRLGLLRECWRDHSRLKDSASFEKVKEALAELDGKPWWEPSRHLIREEP